jgi:uncharacterized repeat protein (TIGR02543 family)
MNRKHKLLSYILAVALALTAVFALPFVGTGGSSPEAYAADAEPQAGDTVYFGAYEQANDGADGEPIAWKVLKSAEGKLFLLSEKNLDAKPYHVDREHVTWEKSTIRSWLNGYGASANDGGAEGIDYSGNGDSFIGKAFTEAEREAIATTLVVNDDNPDYYTEGGNNTNDKIFLLSIDEAKNTDYFANDNARKAVNTAYVASLSGMYSEGSAYFWWLRSPGGAADCAAYVRTDGWVHSPGNLDSGAIAARPAFYLNLESVIFKSESENFYSAIPKSSVIKPTITTTILPGGKVEAAYSQKLAGTTDSGFALVWSVESGNLPTGLALAPDGTVSGEPTAVGNFTFTVRAANAVGSDTESFSIAVEKGEQTRPAAPTAEERTTVSITLNTIAGAEYSKDGTTWQDSPVFDALTPDTAYTLYARIKEDQNYNASPSSNATITTLTVPPVPVKQEQAQPAKAQKYKVTFNTNGGKAIAAKTKIVTKGKKIGKLPKATRKGYNFKGWYTKKNGGKRITANTVVKFTKNTSLYAHWARKQLYGKVKQPPYGGLHIRTGPSSRSKAMGWYKPNRTFRIYGKVDRPGVRSDWYKVKYKGRVAYMYAPYIVTFRK